MSKMIFIGAVLSLTGCATSSGVLPVRPDTYMVTWEGGSAASQPASLKASALREAGEYCAKDGKQLDVVKMNDVGLGFLRNRRAEIEFKCSGAIDPARLPAKTAAAPEAVSH